MVRALSRPPWFSAALPFGPNLEHVELDSMAATASGPPGDIDVDHYYSHLIPYIENDLSKTSGHDSAQATAHAGRAHGIGFAWKNAYGPLATQCFRSTPVSRARRRVAGWLGALCRAGVSSAEARKARRRLLCYENRLPSSGDAACFES